MHVLTLTTLAGMPAARTLGRSLSRTQPGWTHEIVLIAGEDVVSAAAGDGALVRGLPTELGLELEPLLALHDDAELVALLVPALLEQRARDAQEPLLHLPASAWVLGGLEDVSAAIAARGLLLATRFDGELPDDGLEPSREQAEEQGRVERALIGLTPGGDSRAFLEWWSGRVQEALGSLDTRDAGARPEDRHWLSSFLELAPARFAAAVIEHPGWNLSMWNLDRHLLTGSPDAVVVDGEWPLLMLNLPGFDPERPHRLNAIASRARVSRSPVLHELCERYAEQLRGDGWSDLDRRADVGRMLAADLVFDEPLRAMYGSALALGEAIDDPFAEPGGERFMRWLSGPAPRGARHGVNRYVFHRVARARPDVVRTYPDLDGDDGRGFVEWCHAFGARELALPERFLPGGARGPGHGTGARSVDTLAPRTRIAAATATLAPPRTPAPVGDLAVRLTGYLGHTLGLGAAARGYARALSVAGVPVTTASVPLHHVELPVTLDAGYGRHGFEELVHEGEHGFEIVAVNADELPALVARLGEGYFQGPRIGIWGWETNAIPSRWSQAFELIDEIWVYSRFMAQNIGAVAPVPVVALPPPVEVRHAQAGASLRLGVPDGFLFLFVFDYMSTIQRKNPVGLIDAFRRAFEPGEGPQLLIKTINAPLRPLAEEEVLWAAHGREDIHVVDRSLAGPELELLMATCDCYASLHRAEGFGLTMAEAMALGKPVIATAYSGNVDFMDERNSYLIDYAPGRVGPECEIYPPEGEWAEPDVGHAAELMRRVYDEPDEARARGERAAADIARLLSPAATGAAMRERLHALRGAAGAEQQVTGVR